MADRADYQAVLADLRAKRAEIDIAIAALERFLGVMGGPAMPLPVQPVKFYGGGVVLGHAPARPQANPKPYKGLTIKAAAAKHLESVRLKQTPRQIADALIQGGFGHKSKNFPNTVRTTMAREPEFIKVGSEWALRAWYPAEQQELPTDSKQSSAH